MSSSAVVTRRLIGACLIACLVRISATAASPTAVAPWLAGTWTLVAADVQHPDGSRASDYGAAPKGLFIVDRQGHYSLQIFRSDRPLFAANDKSKGSDSEYKAAVMGSSTHFGTVEVDSTSGELVFNVSAASFPNQDGKQERRHYELKDNVLSYRVAPRPNGDVPLSVWRRVDSTMTGH